jgi:hypothetical protein
VGRGPATLVVAKVTGRSSVGTQFIGPPPCAHGVGRRDLQSQSRASAFVRLAASFRATTCRQPASKPWPVGPQRKRQRRGCTARVSGETRLLCSAQPCLERMPRSRRNGAQMAADGRLQVSSVRLASARESSHRRTTGLQQLAIPGLNYRLYSGSSMMTGTGPSPCTSIRSPP